MVEIAKCRLCGRLPSAKIVRNEVVRPHYLSCANLDCGVDGPLRHTEAEAIWAWNALMSAAPEPAAGTVRKAVQIATDSEGLVALASDGTLWSLDMRQPDPWRQLPPLPQPVEIPGTVESGE